MILDCFIKKDTSLAYHVMWQQGYRMSRSHEVLVYFNTWETFLVSNSNLNSYDCLPLYLYSGAYNDPQCVLLCKLQYSQEYLILFGHSLMLHTLTPCFYLGTIHFIVYKDCSHFRCSH